MRSSKSATNRPLRIRETAIGGAASGPTVVVASGNRPVGTAVALVSVSPIWSVGVAVGVARAVTVSEGVAVATGMGIVKIVVIVSVACDVDVALVGASVSRAVATTVPRSVAVGDSAGGVPTADVTVARVTDSSVAVETPVTCALIAGFNVAEAVAAGKADSASVGTVSTAAVVLVTVVALAVGAGRLDVAVGTASVADALGIAVSVSAGSEMSVALAVGAGRLDVAVGAA